MQKITPFLWFDDQVEEAVKLYTSVFKEGKTGQTARYDEASAEVSGKKVGDVLTIEFEILGYKMVALNGGPLFKFTPAVSFFMGFATAEEVEEAWNKLIEGGEALMPLDKYPFNDKYGWLKDKFGVSWQLMVGDERVTPSLLFVGDQYGRAKEAMEFYTSLFPDSRINIEVAYEPGEDEGGKEGVLKFAEFELAGQKFGAMDSGFKHLFGFTEAISFEIDCKDQEEVDKYWNALTASGGEESQCGWLKDKFGVSWQVVPSELTRLLSDPDPEVSQKAMKAMLSMKKIVIEDLK